MKQEQRKQQIVEILERYTGYAKVSEKIASEICQKQEEETKGLLVEFVCWMNSKNAKDNAMCLIYDSEINQFINEHEK